MPNLTQFPEKVQDRLTRGRKYVLKSAPRSPRDLLLAAMESGDLYTLQLKNKTLWVQLRPFTLHHNGASRDMLEAYVPGGAAVYLFTQSDVQHALDQGILTHFPDTQSVAA